MKLISTLLCLLISGLVFCQPSLNDSLVMHLSFDGNSNDVSGNGNHATNNGAVLTKDRFGISNSAYRFDGVDDFMETNKSFDYPNRTLSLWIKSFDNSGTNTTEKVAVTQDSDKLSNGYFLVKMNSGNMLLVAGGEGNAFQATADTGLWYHVALVRNGTMGYYYINGVLLDSTASDNLGSSFEANPDLVIGAGRSTSIQFFNGDIDDLRVYNRALLPSEIDSLFNVPNPTLGKNKTTLPLVNIYPNPTASMINIESNEVIDEVTVHDSFGRLLATQEQVKSKAFSMPVNLPNGLYLLRITAVNGNSSVRRIEVNK